MAFTIQLRYGDISATISNDNDWHSLQADDMAGICRRQVLKIEAGLIAIHSDDEPEQPAPLTHNEAMRREFLLEDDDE